MAPGLMPAYVAPWMLWLGGLAEPERGYLRMLLAAVDRQKYTTVVEPAAGLLAVSLLAADLGMPASQLAASDVTFVPVVAGYVAAGRDLAELDARVDDSPLRVDGSPAEAATNLCYEFSLAKTRATFEKTPSAYLLGMIDDLEEHAHVHRAAIRTALIALAAPLRGITFTPRCLFDHTQEAQADEHAAVFLNPPSYSKGYEKLYDTGGRVTWNEPAYEMFEPVAGVRRLLEESSEAEALVLVRTEDRQAIEHEEQIVYARYLGGGRHIFYAANRPDEVRGLVGGNKVGANRAATSDTPKRPPLPADHEITAESEIGVEILTAGEARYLKDLWMHRPLSATSTCSWALVIDGCYAAVGGWQPDSAMRKVRAGTILLMFTFAAPHKRRILRLLSKIALQRATVNLLSTPKLAMQVTAADRVLTVDETAKPESKSKRGLMTLVERQADPKRRGQFRLFYLADIE